MRRFFELIKTGFIIFLRTFQILPKYPYILIPIIIFVIIDLIIYLWLIFHINPVFSAWNGFQKFSFIFVIFYLECIILSVSCVINLEILQHTEERLRVKWNTLVKEFFTKDFYKVLIFSLLWAIANFLIFLLSIFLSRKEGRRSLGEEVFIRELYSLTRYTAFLTLPAIAWEDRNVFNAVKRGLNIARKNIVEFGTGFFLTEAGSWLGIFIGAGILIILHFLGVPPFTRWVTSILLAAIIVTITLYLEQMYTALLFLYQVRLERNPHVSKYSQIPRLMKEFEEILFPELIEEKGEPLFLFHFPSTSIKTIQDKITDIKVQNRSIFVSSLKGACVYKEEENMNFWEEIENEPTYCMEVENEYLWLGLRRGIKKINLKTYKMDFYEKEINRSAVFCIKMDKGKIYFGTENGVFVFDGKRWENILKNEIVKCIAFDENFLYLGGMYGIIKIDRNIEKIERITKKDGLSDDYINTILTEGEKIWIGTNSGLTLFDGNKFKSIFKNIRVNEIKKDIRLPVLWIGTNNGIFIYSFEKEKFENFNIFHGIPDNSVTTINLTQQKVWIGTKRGLVYTLRDTLVIKFFREWFGEDEEFKKW